jgi:16S rRNA G966 N2-methylase RsmD
MPEKSVGDCGRADRLNDRLPDIHDFFCVKYFNGQTPMCEASGPGILYAESRTEGLKRVFDRFLAGRKNAVDLGFGNGKVVALMSQYADRVTGIELNKEYYGIGEGNIQELAGKKAVDKGRIRLLRGDFFRHDLSEYDFLYLYWPYTREVAGDYERILDRKLGDEMSPEAVFAVNTNGYEPTFRNLFEISSDHEKRRLDDIRVYRSRRANIRQTL